ncbi:hypothetical protein [Luteolibacter luteus]|uniref:Uncharacterized protein n=1 Tax=Luteolibacter luteus TaxID=2728835 RepID=A0A858RI55_9BACT|nr:hypothetical protein [Luteolibacter luteus]QJE96876.1 hypothetical protein HHL09_14145 [Luteolibacter luteus]
MIRETLERMQRLLFAFVLFVPSILAAHPGHYHPGEEDEFDQLRADYFHLHGYLEIGLAAVALVAIGLLHFHSSRKVKIGAAIAFSSSVALIVAF